MSARVEQNMSEKVHPLGRWGGFMKASAYCALVVMDVATIERDCATKDVEATSVLPEVANMACE